MLANQIDRQHVFGLMFDKVGLIKNPDSLRIEVLKVKDPRASITQAELHYVGSITIDEDLMDAANLIEGEKVAVVNVNNGEALETYVIKGERGSGWSA
jgi:L-aspartate-alpha-decarboxylase